MQVLKPPPWAQQKIKIVSLILSLKRWRCMFSHLIKNSIKRTQMHPFGFRADSTTSIAWSVSADGGGQGGRIVVGAHSALDAGVILRANGNTISIGRNSTINPYCMIHGGGGITIGDGVRIGPHTVITAANHIFDDPSKPIYLQGESEKGIVIENDVWIGSGAGILDGVVVATGTVVGAGAVVTKSTPAYSVVVGVPAKVIKMRI